MGGSDNGNELSPDHLARVLSMVQRLTPWAKFRGLAALVPIDLPDELGPQVIVSKDPITPGRIVVFIQPDALAQIRKDWEYGREIDTIPSDDEIAAWLAWIVVTRNGS